MIPPLSELVVRIPVETIFSQSLAVAREIGLPETAWQPISIGREVIYINSQIASNFSIVMQEGVAAGGFLTYAKGAWLTLCAYEIFDTARIDSSSATGKIRLNNSSAAPFTFGVGAVRVLNETANKTYTNTTAGVVPAGGHLDTTEFIADEPGSASNLTSTDVLSLVTTVPGVTPQFQENLIGQDEETDPQLEKRARLANAKASPNGPGDAYEYYALTTTRPDGTFVGVTRYNKVEGNGTVTMYLADADGALASDDRGYVFDNVNENVVPTGFTLLIPTPTCAEKDVPVSVTLTPNPNSSASQTDIRTRIEEALVAYYATVNPGGAKGNAFSGLFRSTINQVIRNAAGLDVLNAILTAPATDTAMALNEIPILSALTVNWTT